MENTILKLESVTKSYDTQSRTSHVLKGIDFELCASKKVAIMGASGSGKSTLLHLCGGLTPVTTGKITIHDQCISSMNDTQCTLFRRDQIGIIFQAFNLISTLNVRENILLPLYASSSVDSLAISRMKMLVESLDIAHHLDHYVDELSGGEQQRVAIARALITDPILVLADEPTGSLDSLQSRIVCELLMKSECTENKSVLIVTHEPKVAFYADEIIVIKDGKICAQLARNQFDSVAALALEYQTILS